MARDSATRLRRDRENKRDVKTRSEEHVYNVPVPERLHEAIESERDNLAKAESVLGCLVISLESDGDLVNGPYYPHLAEIARGLVRQSINRLDSLTLYKLLTRTATKDESS